LKSKEDGFSLQDESTFRITISTHTHIDNTSKLPNFESQQESFDGNPLTLLPEEVAYLYTYL